ncbi:MAG: methionyl-tRNA formyltransferase [Cyanobacteria bacterium SID2]|nr:methionyl-tRNA formyltransferase [Cyanobacteria bacterium SID2]MBP0004495.1 methionyl-tRNA formyltransferase [Cyanobacteria bacterium SBC]
MKIIFFGTPQFAVPTLQRLIDRSEFDILAVVTQPDKRRGRDKYPSPSPVKEVAVNSQIPVWQPRRVKKDAETLEKLSASEADAFVVVAYGQLLSTEILQMPRLGCLNGHGSLLPEYRGAAPIQWCLYDGKTRTGMTSMFMDEGMDTGAMLLKSEVEIGLLENAWELAARLSEQCADLLVETLLRLDRGDIEAILQDNDAATYASLIHKEDYHLDWQRRSIELHNQIRGFYPNCTAHFRDKSIKIKATAPLGDTYWAQLPEEFAQLKTEWEDIAGKSGAPGEVVHIAKHLGPIVETGEGKLLLREVQISGKKTQCGWDFANGTRLEVGERLSDG